MLDKPDGARACDVRDQNARRFQRQDAGSCALRVRRQVDEEIEIVAGDPQRGFAFARIRERDEAVRDSREAVGPIVALA